MGPFTIGMILLGIVLVALLIWASYHAMSAQKSHLTEEEKTFETMRNDCPIRFKIGSGGVCDINKHPCVKANCVLWYARAFYTPRSATPINHEEVRKSRPP